MLFQSYNARFLDLKSIGSTFVLREEAFREVSKQNNSLMIGPRGSGKTTLLKMLKISARQAARPEKNFHLLKDIKYTPAYVGADRQFALKTNFSRGELDNQVLVNALEHLTAALITVRVKYAFLDTLHEITSPDTENSPVVSHHFVPMNREREKLLCETLSRSWGIVPVLQNVVELRAELLNAIDKINGLVTELSLGRRPEDLVSRIAEIPNDPINAATSFVGSFNDVFNDPSRLWALCVDEMEIMPQSLQEYFFGRLRSIDNRILLKLATSPFSRAFSEEFLLTDRPAGAHDFSVVDLSDPKKREGAKFTRRLLAELLKQSGLHGGTTPEKILGRSSVVDEPRVLGSSPYKAPDGAHYRRFKRLAERDASFAAYLSKNGIVVDALDRMEGTSRAAMVRKAIWQVALREFYGANQDFKAGGGVERRVPSRKVLASAYTGSESVISMCEANPRITIGIFKDVLAAYKSNGQIRLSDAQQSTIIVNTMAKFLSFLSSIPMGERFKDRLDASLVDLLDAVGSHMSDRNIFEAFRAEPLATIVVDQGVSEAVLQAIGAGVNQGALVMVEDSSGTEQFGELRGARLRLSYLLCPRYRLPLTLGDKILLSSAMDAKSVRRTRPLEMKDLFENEA